MSENEKLVEKFLDGLGSDKEPVRTENIDNAPVRDGWMSAFWDNDLCIGWTVVAYNEGNFLARIDLTKDKLGPDGAGALAKRIFGKFWVGPR